MLFLFRAQTADSAGFTMRKKITIQASQVSGASALTDFPVMIKLTGSDFQEIENDTRSDGYDLVFRASDGITPLAHEIEVYDETADLLVAWVKIPTLSPTIDTEIYMYYGDSALTAPTETPTAVWDPNFKGVWHLNEDPSGTAPQIMDSTVNANHGTSQGGMKSNDRVAGKIGEALDFDGSDDYINGGSDSSLDATTGLTLEAWVEPDQVEWASRYVLYKANAYFLSSMRSFDNTPNFYLYINGVGWQAIFTGGTLTTGWNHLVATYDTTQRTMRIYIDGVEVKSLALTGLSNYTIRTTTNILWIGGPWSDGVIDEARVSDIARSADWIKTQFNNQGSPSGFYSVAGEEPVSTDLPTITITSPTSASSYSTDTGVMALAGSASDDTGVVEVTWTNDAGGSGVCSGTDIWSAASISLAPGANVITVAARDDDNNTATDVLTVTYTPADDGGGGGGGDGGSGGTGDTELFQSALEPNVLILFDTSGSMADVMWLDGFDPDRDYATPLLSQGKTVVFVQDSVNCYPDENYVSTTTALSGKSRLEYQNQDGSGNICGSIATSQLSDSNGYFYFDRDGGDFIDAGSYDSGNPSQIKVFLPYGTESVDPPNIYYKSCYDYEYLNWIFYHSNQADRDALEDQHKDPAKRAMLMRVHVGKKVVKDLIDNTPEARFGIMRFDPTYAVYDGGRILADIPSSNADLHAALDSFWVAGRTPLAEALEDAWDYFRGVDVYGHSFTQDYWCRRNFVIVMTDGAPSSDSNDLTSGMKKDWDGDSGGTEANGWTGNEDNLYPGDGSDYLDDVAHYIRRNDARPDLEGTQRVTVHTIGFTINHSLLQDTAINGGGQYYTANNAQELSVAFRDIIQEIVEISTSYTAPVVPISRNEKTTSGDRIYLALFKPSLSAFWKGNIKKFGIATTDNDGLGIKKGDILDRNGDLATDGSGHILDTAASYWGIGSPDGGDAEKGGVGEVLLNRATPRNIYTYVDAGNPLTHPNNAFSKLNPMITKVRLGTEDPAEKIIDFVHGYDTYDEDGDSDTAEKRSWVLGAFLHSRPEVIYYNSSRTVIFAGANDGMLHAFDESTGEELWAYIPPVFLSRLKDLTGTSQVYFVDGSPKVYLNDVKGDGEISKADGDEAILLSGLRRGGRYYFALDVTKPLNPEIPTGWRDWGVWEGDPAAWRSTGMIGPDMTTESGDEALATYPYGEMGQSWSVPIIGEINDGGSARDVAFISGGYDHVNQDLAIPGSDTMGRGVFVVDPLTGDLFWKYTYGNDANMLWSVPSDIAAIDTTGSGLIDRLYVGDMGGKLWRFNIRSSDTANWTAKILFDANSSALPGEPLRKIFYPPDVTLEEGYELLFFGTGDRADPKSLTLINRIYAIKDENQASTLVEGDLEDVTDDLLQDPDYLGDKQALRDQIMSGNGWYIRLVDNFGEKVLAPSLVFGGVAYFTTFTPTALDDPCVFEEGAARLYALNYRTGEAVLNYDTSNEGVGKIDRSLVIGSAIPSGLVLALIQGKPEAYIGIRGGILNPAIGTISPLIGIYWRSFS